ncbi:MAG: hypothetical protein ACRD4H_11580, partial [Candidatus Acidiferrales bacterium]
DELCENDSWCGETHLQKATYFLQDLLQVPTDFDFILYKHGPFSFDLRDELTALRADCLLELRPQLPYGPSLVTTEAGHALEKQYPKTLKKHKKAIRFVAEQLGNKNVSELERLATALFVTLESGQRSTKERANEIHSLKPHVTEQSATSAVEEVDAIIESAKHL